MANTRPASFDRRQILSINYVYTLPKTQFGNAWTKMITNGWQLSGVTIAQTGAPFTPSVNVQNSNNSIITGSYTEGSRPVIVAGCNPYTGSKAYNNYLNPACFLPPSVGSMGLESGINYLNGLGGVNFDMALQKEFAVIKDGKVRFQFRADAFNVFNHTIFTGVNSGLSLTSVSRPTAAASSPACRGYTSTALAINNPAQGVQRHELHPDWRFRQP